MPKKEQNEVEQLNKQLGDQLKMPIVQQPTPPSGSTEYAKDKVKK